jgi:hypothetical protein
MFNSNKFRITLPARDSAAKCRNLLISIDGRSSSRNIPIDQKHHDVLMGMGSFIFLRVTDKDRTGSMWVYETDFLLVPGISIAPEDGFEVERVD